MTHLSSPSFYLLSASRVLVFVSTCNVSVCPWFALFLYARGVAAGLGG